MRKLGKKQLAMQLQVPLDAFPRRSRTCRCRCPKMATRWSTRSTRRRRTPASRALLRRLHEQGIDFKDLHSSETSLEDIFVSLVRQTAVIGA
jgi:ABC-2 type transport system ATP-binding protein